MSQKSADHSKRRPPRDKAPEGHQDADWGFESDEADPAIEKKLGIILVLCLLAGFGFVFYQKFRILQEQPPSAQSREQAADRSPALAGTADPLTAAGRSASEPPVPSSATDTPFYEPEESAADGQGAWMLTQAEAPPPSAPTPAPAAIPPAAAHAHSETSEAFDPFTEPTPGANPDAAPAAPPEITWDASPAAAPRQSESDPFLMDESEAPADDATSAEAPFVVDDEPEGTAPVPPPPEPADEPGLFVFHAPDESPSADAGDPTTNETSMVPQQQVGRTSDEESQPLLSLDAPQSPTASAAAPEQFDPFAASVPEEPAAATASEPADEPSLVIAPSPHEEQVSREPAPVAITEPPAWPFADATPMATSEPQTSSRAAEPDEPPQVIFDRGRLPSARANPHVSASSSAQAARNPFAIDSAAPPPFVASALSSQAVIGERQITVTQSDSFWSISEREYGTSRYFAALARYNRDRVGQPEKLQSGMKVRIPPPEVLEAQFPEQFQNAEWRDRQVSPISGTSTSFAEAAGLVIDEDLQPWYRVGERDTLSSIAQAHLGRASRWTEIYDLNRDQLTSPSTLKVGLVLKLPPDAGRVSVSPAGGLNR